MSVVTGVRLRIALFGEGGETPLTNWPRLEDWKGRVKQSTPEEREPENVVEPEREKTKKKKSSLTKVSWEVRAEKWDEYLMKQALSTRREMSTSGNKNKQRLWWFKLSTCKKKKGGGAWVCKHAASVETCFCVPFPPTRGVHHQLIGVIIRRRENTNMANREVCERGWGWGSFLTLLQHLQLLQFYFKNTFLLALSQVLE